MITRARTHLAVILVDFLANHDCDDDAYSDTKNHFKQAAANGLIDIVHLGAN